MQTIRNDYQLNKIKIFWRERERERSHDQCRVKDGHGLGVRAQHSNGLGTV